MECDGPIMNIMNLLQRCRDLSIHSSLHDDEWVMLTTTGMILHNKIGQIDMLANCLKL